MRSWQELSRKTVFQGYGGRNVDRVTFELPDGTTGEYDIKVEPDAVCVLALTTAHRFLTVRQHRLGPNLELDELPGGMHDAGGTPEDAAARELKEETGYTPGHLELVAKIPQDAYNSRFKWGYVATDCVKTGEQTLEPTEFATVNEWEAADFLRHVTSGQMTDVEVAMLGLVNLGYFVPLAPNYTES